MNNLCLVFYGVHTTAINTLIKNALPYFMISNVELWEWNGTQNYTPSEFQAVGIKDLTYTWCNYAQEAGGPSIAEIEAHFYKAKNTYGCWGVFLDVCPPSPTTAQKTFLSTVITYAHSIGLPICCNIGMAAGDLTWYFDTAGLDYLMCQEQYNKEESTATQKLYEGKILILTEYTSPATAAEAIDRTQAAWAQQLTYHFACEAGYTTLPSYLADYVAGLVSESGSGVTGLISVAADDGFSDGDANFDNDSTWVEMGAGAYVYGGFFRFTELGIPANATITSAVLQMVVTQWDADTHLKVFANHEEHPTAPTDGATHAAKTRTSAGIDWDSSPGDLFTYHDSPDITTVIAEVLAAHGASGLDEIMILVDDDTSTAGSSLIGNSYENTGYPAKLKIEWTVPATAISPAPFNITLTMDTPTVTVGALVYIWKRTA